MKAILQKQEDRLKVNYSLVPPFPREVFLDVTNFCNHECFFCSNTEMRKKAMIDPMLAKRLLREAREYGSTDVGLYATGEPFLYPHLEAVLREAKNLGFKYVFLTTNGSLCTPENVKRILDAGLDSIKFSINAGTRRSYKRVHGKDDFEKVINNVKWCYQYKVDTGMEYGIYVSMVKTKQTENEDKLLKEILLPYVEDFQVRGCSNQGGNKIENNVSEIIQKGNLLGSLRSGQMVGVCCLDIFGRATITPEGYLSACVVDYQNYLIVADLNKCTLKEAWESEVYKDLRRRHLDAELDGIICNCCLNNIQTDVYPLNEKYAKAFT